MALTATVTPGVVVADDDYLTPAMLNSAANPTIAVTGNLSDVTNVATTAPANGQPLVYATGTSKWGPGSVAAAYAPASWPAGMVLGLRATTALKVLTLTADYVSVATTGGVTKLVSAVSATCTLANSGALGQLDTGTYAADTWYYFYVVSDGTSSNLIGSVQPTWAEAAPFVAAINANYIYGARVSEIYAEDNTQLRSISQTDLRVNTNRVTAYAGAVAETWNNLADPTNFKKAVPLHAKTCFGNVGTTVATEMMSVGLAGAQSDGGVPGTGERTLGRCLFNIRPSTAAGVPPEAATPYYASAFFELPVNGGANRNILTLSALGTVTYRIEITGYTL